MMATSNIHPTIEQALRPFAPPKHRYAHEVTLNDDDLYHVEWAGKFGWRILHVTGASAAGRYGTHTLTANQALLTGMTLRHLVNSLPTPAPRLI